MIVSDWKSRAKVQARLHVDSLVQALDDHDHPAALDAARRLRATCDWIGHELIPLVVHDDHDRLVDLRAALFTIRQQRQHLLGSPRDFAALSAEESRLVAELQQVTA